MRRRSTCRSLLATYCRRPQALFLILLAAYALSFLPLYRFLGPQLIILSLIPVIAAGRCLGMWAGTIAGLIVFLLHIVFFALVTGNLGKERNLFMEGGLLGSAGITLLGALIGRLRDLHVQLSRKLAELARARAALQESEEKYRRLVENANEAIVVVQEGSLQFVNPKAMELVGYSPEELLAISFIELIHPDDRDVLLARYHEILTGQNHSPSLTVRLITKGRRTRWVELNAVRITWEGRPGVLTLISDVTERREAEERLRESEARFRMITEESLVGVYIIQDGKIRYANPALARIFGYASEEIIDRLSPLDLTYPEDRPLVSEKLRQRLEGEIEVAHYTFRGLRKDGRRIHCEVMGRRLSYQGRPALVGTLLDVTERKKAEEELKETNVRLQAALKVRDEMIQNVSHELRTPLTLIKGYVEMLKEQAFGPLTPAQQEAIAVLDGQSNRLRYMIDRLLMLQTLDSSALRETALDLKKLLEDVIETWKPRGGRTGVRFHLDLPAHLPAIKADGELLYHVFHNLLDNAVKFSPAGGEVHILARQEGRHIVITVSDQGIGIPPDKLERVFEQFYQVDGGMTRRFGGMGIGLALCRRIVELHGGRIWAESEGEGRGSLFHITLPFGE